MEVGYGTDGKSCGHGGSHAGGDGGLAGNPAGHWSTYASSRFCRFPVPRRPLGLGVGHVMDLGTTGSGARIAWARGGTRRSSLGYRRVAGTAAPLVPVVVMSESACECRSSLDRKSTRLNSSHANISYAVFCLQNTQDVSN